VAVGQFADEQALHRSLVGDHAADVEAEQLVLPFLGGPAGQDVCDRVAEWGVALKACAASASAATAGSLFSCSTMSSPRQ
jgi:hypothetical protein